MKTTLLGLLGLLVTVLLPLREAAGQFHRFECSDVPRLAVDCGRFRSIGYIDQDSPFSDSFKRPVFSIGDKMFVTNVYDFRLGDSVQVYFDCEYNVGVKKQVIGIVESEESGFLRMGFLGGRPSWLDDLKIDFFGIDSSETLEIVTYVEGPKTYVKVQGCQPTNEPYRYRCPVISGYAASGAFRGVMFRGDRMVGNIYRIGYNNCSEVFAYVETFEGGNLREAVEAAWVVGVEEMPSLETLSLSVPWPNPIVNFGEFELSVERPSQILLEIYDIQGRRVRVLYQGSLSPGLHRFSFDALDMPSGIYFVRAIGAMNNATQKFVVAK